MSNLAMELRSIDTGRRTVVGLCVPYNETSYLTPDPGGERVVRGAFAKSITERGDRIWLNRAHKDDQTVGRSLRWDDTDDGLLGEFHIRPGQLGDETLAELDDGYWPGLSVGFKTVRQRRAADGAVEVLEGYLAHVALERTPAYETAQVLSVRTASVADVLAGFGPRPVIDLSPLPSTW